MPRRFYGSNNWIFRKTPVPYTRCARPSELTCYRRPRTFQEMKWNIPFGGDNNRNGLDDDVFSRAKRHRLPNAWDDKVRYTDRSWKSNRKHQYKE